MRLAWTAKHVGFGVWGFVGVVPFWDVGRRFGILGLVFPERQ